MTDKIYRWSASLILALALSLSGFTSALESV